MPDAPGLELILAEVNDTYPGAVLDTSFDREQAALIVNPGEILNVLGWLKETPGQEYTFLSSVHGADYLPGTPRFGVHYEMLNRDRYERLRVKAVLHDPAARLDAAAVANPDGRLTPGTPSGSPTTSAPTTGSVATKKKTSTDVGEDSSSAGPDTGPDESDDTVSDVEADAAGIPGNSLPGASPLGAETADDGLPQGPPPVAASSEDGLPHLPSCVGLYPTAEFQEREVYDFFGIVFDGHPDLRRILMPDDYVGWPQRRDFPVGGEPVIFTRDEVTNPSWWQ